MLIFVFLIPVFSSVEYESRPGRERRVQQIEGQQDHQGRRLHEQIEQEEQAQQIVQGELEQPTIAAEEGKTVEEELTAEDDIIEQTDKSIQDQPELPHEVSDAEVDVRGYMSLREVSERFNVPVDHILKELDITDKIDERETLGRLRRSYSFEMHDVRGIIQDYMKKN